MIKCKALKPFSAFKKYEVGEIAELSEDQFKQLKIAGIVEPINSCDSSPNKMYKEGKNKKGGKQ